MLCSSPVVAVKNHPFYHAVIDNFFEPQIAEEISSNFFDYDDPRWTATYNNPLERKKACSHWDLFPAPIYNALFYLCSKPFADKHLLNLVSEKNIFADYGLHGGGMHAHRVGGKLNIHKDYSIHPKLEGKMRVFNLIVYLTPDWNPNWGGGLEFWSHDAERNQPKEMVTRIENRFNRAVLFNTTQNSWHGLPDPINCPANVYRKSLAVYYLSELDSRVESRKRALYAPYGDQQNDPEIIEFCKKRSGIE